MERAGRSRSLADLSSNSGKVTDTPPASHLSLYDVRDPPRYHKENLLDHGSPPGSPGYSTECDPSLLNIDSDNPETSETTGDMSKDVKMIIDNVMDIDNNRSVDPLYHQCKTARRMSFVDRLVISGLPKDNLSVLVRSLVKTIHRCFQTCASPENYLARDIATVATVNCEQKVVLLGASNLGSCAGRLHKLGKIVIDLTQPGWLASKENIDGLTEKLDGIHCNEYTTLVFDLFGNSSFRFEQFDGSLSMPFKSSGRYHMAGKIVPCPLPRFRRILDSTSALLTKYRAAKSVIILPLPRYLFSGCCKQPDHSTNIKEPGYSSNLLSETIGLSAIVSTNFSVA
jgi:hypothetical protein